MRGLPRRWAVVAITIVSGACVPPTRSLVRSVPAEPVGEPRLRIGDVVHVRRSSSEAALLRGPVVAASDSGLTMTVLDPQAADTAGLHSTPAGTSAVRARVAWHDVASVAMPLDIALARGIPHEEPPPRTSSVIGNTTAVVGVVAGVTCGLLSYQSLHNSNPSFDGLNLTLATMAGFGCLGIIAVPGKIASDVARAAEGPGDPGRWVVIPNAREQLMQPDARVP
jgi:hypothetical protein